MHADGAAKAFGVHGAVHARTPALGLWQEMANCDCKIAKTKLSYVLLYKNDGSA